MSLRTSRPGGPLHYLWDVDDRDSPLWVYMLFGLPPVFIWLGAIAGAVYVLRKR